MEENRDKQMYGERYEGSNRLADRRFKERFREMVRGTADTESVRCMDRFWEESSSWLSRFPEMAWELKNVYNRHLDRYTAGFHNLGNEISSVMKYHWKLAPPHVIGRLMFSIIGRSIPLDVDAPELVSTLEMMLVMAKKARSECTYDGSCSDDPFKIGLRVSMTHLPDLCMEVLPSIISQIKYLQKMESENKSGCI